MRLRPSALGSDAEERERSDAERHMKAMPSDVDTDGRHGSDSEGRQESNAEGRQGSEIERGLRREADGRQGSEAERRPEKPCAAHTIPGAHTIPEASNDDRFSC